jgi:hypothetical protein
VPDIGARRSWWGAGIGRDGASSREPAPEQGDVVGLVNERLSGTGESAAAPMPVASPFDRRVIWVGGIVFAVLMVLSARYGFDRDELYFLDGARHLQASYVDQPVLAPLLAWVSLKLFGVSLPGLRVWPALVAWATVVVSGRIAREFGGGKRAQLLAAIGTATMPVLLGAAHVANTTAYELLAWAGLALVVARIGRTGDCRWWLAGGLVVGLGVADDHSMSFFAIALVIGALLSGGRRMIWNRWFLAGAAIAVAFEVPDLWWQAQHQWATIAMTHALNQENGGLANIGTWVVGQLGMVTLALAWVWVAGLRFLWRSGRPLWRAMAWAYGLLFVLFAVTTGVKTVREGQVPGPGAGPGWAGRCPADEGPEQVTTSYRDGQRVHQGVGYPDRHVECGREGQGAAGGGAVTCRVPAGLATPIWAASTLGPSSPMRCAYCPAGRGQQPAGQILGAELPGREVSGPRIVLRLARLAVARRPTQDAPQRHALAGTQP